MGEWTKHPCHAMRLGTGVYAAVLGRVVVVRCCPDPDHDRSEAVEIVAAAVAVAVPVL